MSIMFDFISIFYVFPLIQQRQKIVHLLITSAPNFRLVPEFDLLFYAFGKPWTVTWAWTLMFVYTLVVPYYMLAFWAAFYHSFSSKLGLSVGTGLVLCALQSCILGVFPIYVVVHNQLPPASRFIVILEQVSECMCVTQIQVGTSSYLLFMTILANSVSGGVFI